MKNYIDDCWKNHNNKQAVPINGDNIPPALITTHLIQKYPIKIFILQSGATQVGILQENFVPEEFRHHFAY